MARSILLFAVLALSVSQCGVPPHNASKPHHAPKGFRNNYPHEDHGFGDILKWQWQSRGRQAKEVHYSVAANDPEFLQQNRQQSTLTWIGHATFLLQFDGTNILTDPHCSERASPVSFAGPKRKTPPGLALEELPLIDIVVISHNHYDHLDEATVRGLYERQKERPPRFFVPLGVKAFFTDLGIDEVVEMDWWDSLPLQGWTIHAVPVQHFSGRSLFDRDETLWAGWVLEHPEFKFFFAGDTGYSADFRVLGERLGPFDLAAIPIGAYEPRWFMSAVHVDPAEAVLIHQDVGARYSVGMHWGTFLLADEDMDEPPRRLAAARAAAGIPAERFFVMQHGETRLLDFLFYSKKPSL